jgi:glycosyltransferase involved in cell wall biosynthesis
MKPIPYRLGLEQRLFPEYRRSFFEMLAASCPRGFCLFAGKAREGEEILETQNLKKGEWVQAKNQYLFGGRRLLYRQTNFLAWLKSWKPEVLIVEANPRLLGLKPVIQYMHQHGGRVIGWGLGFGGNQDDLTFLRKQINKTFIRQFDVLLSYSQKGKQEYLQAGFAGEHIFVAPNAMTPCPEWAIPRRKKGFQKNKPVVLFVGRLLERKSVHRLIEACAQLPGKIHPKLVIVGDGPERGSLEILSSRTYPETYFRGDLRGRSLEDAYREADLFVLPGTGGLAIQQAMSYGLPIISGIGDGTQSDLVRKENGWQLRSDQVDELANTLAESFKDIEKLRKMGEMSFQIVKNEVNLEKMAEEFAKAVEHAMKLDKRK